MADQLQQLVGAQQRLLHDMSHELRSPLARNRRVELHATGRFVMDVNGDLIYRAIENAVRNAVKFTAEAATVEVVMQLAADGRGLTISIRDHGPGVPVSHQQSISFQIPLINGIWVALVPASTD